MYPPDANFRDFILPPLLTTPVVGMATVERRKRNREREILDMVFCLAEVEKRTL